MGNEVPPYIRDLDALRAKLARAEHNASAMGRLWRSVRNRAQQAPDAFPWFVPFVALVTGEAADVAAARRQVLKYIETLDGQSFGMGLQFHFWCYALPHARWALFFRWLDALGAWSDSERREIGERLLLFQFANFFSGLRTKPEPQCVDNQTFSLCYSNALVGFLFRDAPGVSALARRLAAEGFRRLPAMLGGFPPSGYSGEGSTYMDYVVGPTVPWAVELLECAEGGEWFQHALPPNGGSAAAVLRMIVREWLPNGMLLPWDHYGYSLPVFSAVAYAALRTGDPRCYRLLEESANWGHNTSIGWGFDDLVWTLIWWPEQRPAAADGGQAWVEPEIGGALLSRDRELYLMQMWDESTPRTPIRGHVNPNNLVLAAFGSPLTVDGVPAKGCAAFDFDDTWLDRGGLDFHAVRVNFGAGCGGAHGTIMVDGWEGMRAASAYRQAALTEFQAGESVLAADVTPIYRERWPGAAVVRRRSRLCAERFWLVEDLAAFAEPHEVRSRWMLRPEWRAASGGGIEIETAEGVRLRILPLLGPDVVETRTIEGFPDRLDGRCVRADFVQRGRECRWLFLVFPFRGREEAEDVSAHWTVVADPAAAFGPDEARAALARSALRFSIEMPPFLQARLPPTKRWWYARELKRPRPGRWWVRLPRGLAEPAVWIDGVAVDVSARWRLAELMPLDVELPAAAASVAFVLRTDTGDRQYEANSAHGRGSFHGRAVILAGVGGDETLEASYRDGTVAVACGGRQWSVAHELMPVESTP